jgi:hypothetical protein
MDSLEATLYIHNRAREEGGKSHSLRLSLKKQERQTACWKG